MLTFQFTQPSKLIGGTFFKPAERMRFYEWKPKTRTPLPDVNQDWDLIIHLFSDSGVHTVYWVDLNAGWQGVQVAKIVRELRKNRKVMFPFMGDVWGQVGQATQAQSAATKQAEVRSMIGVRVGRVSEPITFKVHTWEDTLREADVTPGK